MIVCWRAVLEGTEAAQKLALLATEQGDVDKGFRPGEHREQTEKEDLVERVGYLALLARILQVFEIAQKNNRLVECGTIRRRVVHGCPPLSEPRRPMASALYRVVTCSFTRLPWLDKAASCDALTIDRKSARIHGRITMNDTAAPGAAPWVDPELIAAGKLLQE